MTLLRYEPWWRMPDAPKRSRGRRRLSGAALSFAGYWIVALAAAYAVHVEWLPARQWLVASTSTSVTAPRARIGRTIQVPVMDVPVTEDTVTVPVAPPPAFVPENEPDPYIAAAPEPEPEREPEAPAPRFERKREARRITRERRKEPKREPEPRVKREKAPIERPVVERAPEPPNPIEPKREPPPKRAARPSSGGGTSCEAAIGSYRESMRIGDRSTPPDISASRYAAVLNRGTYFQHCGVPDSTSIRICAAVQHGRAVGVTVSTSPPSGGLQRCIANAVRGLSFPSHPRMDVTTTVFE